MTNYPATAAPLVEFQPQHPFFIGIDSDGCAFDTMEIKHKECFIPNIINHWGLQSVSKYAREAAEFVNLYSNRRGVNRWPALIEVFDLLRERPEVIARKAAIPQAEKVRQFIASGYPLSDNGLRDYKEKHPDPELDQALAWSVAVNTTVGEMVHDIPPFPYVRESLAKLNQQADLIVVSATPTAALVREWQEHSIDQYVRVIAGQEMGKKEQHLEWAAKNKYPVGKILMIGDALGDLKAARTVQALFYPINPGREDQSWERFYREAADKFLRGEYTAEYEAGLIAEFQKSLPETPPWQTAV